MKKSKIPRGDSLKYTEIIKKLRNNYVHGNQIISQDDLLKLYEKIYLNDNKKTFENMESFLKKNETVIDCSKNSYLVLKKIYTNLIKMKRY